MRDRPSDHVSAQESQWARGFAPLFETKQHDSGAWSGLFEAIGLVGEIVALEWLKRRCRGASEDSWRSGYRDLVLGALLGDDSLGFDFEVPVGRATYIFELKATVGDDMRIELAESEVLLDPARRALTCSRTLTVKGFYRCTRV